MNEKECQLPRAKREEIIEIILKFYAQLEKKMDYDWLIRQKDNVVYAIYKRLLNTPVKKPSDQFSFDDEEFIDNFEFEQLLTEYNNGEFDIPRIDRYAPNNLFNEYGQVDYNGHYDSNGRLLDDVTIMKCQEAMSYRLKK